MALTVNSRFTAVLGPRKKEYILITSDGTNDDTLSTLLANPTYVGLKVVDADLTGTASAASITRSGKTLTLRDGVSARTYEVEVTGF